MTKRPKQTDSGRWRWILPEPGCPEGPHDLPEPVFRRLRSDLAFPWLFATEEAAIRAARAAAWLAEDEQATPPPSRALPAEAVCRGCNNTGVGIGGRPCPCGQRDCPAGNRPPELLARPPAAG